jgi:hypothetical protein
VRRRYEPLSVAETPVGFLLSVCGYRPERGIDLDCTMVICPNQRKVTFDEHPGPGDDGL